jgi:hypothetical protein
MEINLLYPKGLLIMKVKNSNNINEKKEWSQPFIVSLDIKKTEGGSPDFVEDVESGTINTQPSL